MKSVSPIAELQDLFSRYFELLEDGEESTEMQEIREALIKRGEGAVEQFMLIGDIADGYTTVIKDRINALNGRLKQLAIIKELSKHDILDTMEVMGVKKLSLPEGTVTVMPGRSKVVMTEPEEVPPNYLRATIKCSGLLADRIRELDPTVEVIYDLDRTKIKLADKADVGIKGTVIEVGEPYLMIRRKEV